MPMLETLFRGKGPCLSWTRPRIDKINFENGIWNMGKRVGLNKIVVMMMMIALIWFPYPCCLPVRSTSCIQNVRIHVHPIDIEESITRKVYHVWSAIASYPHHQGIVGRPVKVCIPLKWFLKKTKSRLKFQSVAEHSTFSSPYAWRSWYYSNRHV